MKLSFEIFQTANYSNFSSSRENSKPYKSTVTLHPLKLTLETRTIARRGIYKKKARWTPHKECKRHPSLAINNGGIGIRRITNPGVKVTFRGKRRQECNARATFSGRGGKWSGKRGRKGTVVRVGTTISGARCSKHERV